MKEMGPYRSSAKEIEAKPNWFVRFIKRLRCKHSWRILSATNKVGFTPSYYYNAECIKCDKKKLKSFSFWSPEYKEFIAQRTNDHFGKKENFDHLVDTVVDTVEKELDRKGSTDVQDQVNSSTLLMM